MHLHFRSKDLALVKCTLTTCCFLGQTGEVYQVSGNKKIDCDQITIGQYLRPSFNHLAVKKYWDPSEFEYLYRFSKELGFKKVSSGPLVRSSYHAG